MTFDWLAEDTAEPNSWEREAIHRVGRGTGADLTRNLTDPRTGPRVEFLKGKAIVGQGGQGPAKQLDASQWELTQFLRQHEKTATDAASAQQNLGGHAPGSARLLLRFLVKTPLISRDDFGLHLFDNPMRRDPVFDVPHLSAATLKGLARDAFCREYGEEDGAAVKAACRLFGKSAGDQGNQGILRFSPVWFKKTQFIVINPGNKKTAAGSHPIQFEAIAPEQEGVLEILCLPRLGTADEGEIRADLTRLMAALAAWWPQLRVADDSEPSWEGLGLGAKRRAGYGAITARRATLEMLGWSNCQDATQLFPDPAEEQRACQESHPPSEPDCWNSFLNDQGQLLDETQWQSRIRQACQARLTEIDNVLKRPEVPIGRRKQLKAEKAHLERNRREKEDKNYKSCLEYQKALVEYKQQQAIPLPPSPLRAQYIHQVDREGPGSWTALARWLDQASPATGEIGGE